MYAAERQREIAERARGEGRVEVVALAALLDVSLETVRRDLGVLERRGVLRRTHGGAVPAELLRFEPEVAERQQERVAEKARIAERALEFVPRRGTVALDAGTTTAALAEILPADRELTVLTNCLPIASLLASRPSIKVLIAGGRVRARTLAAVDDVAARFIGDFAPEVTFVGTNGIRAGGGLTTPDETEAAVKRALVRGARRVVVLADHTKVGEEHFVRFARSGEVDVLITDTGLDKTAATELEETGMEVLRV
jgi:DeoR family fructose operon transcriptional repressor